MDAQMKHVKTLIQWLASFLPRRCRHCPAYHHIQMAEAALNKMPAPLPRCDTCAAKQFAERVAGEPSHCA